MGNKIFDKVFIILTIVLMIFIGLRVCSHLNPTIEEFVNQETRKDLKVIVYSKKGCKYCTMAKQLLDKKGIYYEVVKLTNNKDLFIKLASQTGQNTVPLIFINDEFIGGYSSLLELSRSGRL